MPKVLRKRKKNRYHIADNDFLFFDCETKEYKAICRSSFPGSRYVPLLPDS